MRIITKTVLVVMLASLSLLSASQVTLKNSVGIQLNPYFDELTFSGFFKGVYAARYTFSIKNNITLGPELSGFWVKSKSTEYRSLNFNAGGYFRYTFLPEKRIRPFLELSSYYTFYKYEGGPEYSYPWDATEPEGSGNYLSWYIAPGVSLWSKSGKVSLDLMYKFSSDYFVNSKKSVFSYRLNFWF